MRRLLLFILFSLPFALRAQTTEIVIEDSLNTVVVPDTVVQQSDSTCVEAWKPNPTHAVWMGALFPGLGQIYNRSYWKLPIVYGGLMGCVYAIIWNGNKYTAYKQAYIDIMTDNPLSDDPTRSYNAVLPKGYTIEMMGGRSTYTRTLNNNQNLYRRYRDFGIVAAVVVYALSLIDAFVDAQLFDFDISPDLSMNVSPQIYQDYMNHQRSAEVHLAITIK